MGRLVLNGQSYTGNEGNDHIYGEDPPRPEQGVEGSMYIQYVATKQEDEHGEIIKVPESIVEVYSKIEGGWMPYSGGEVPETQFYSTVIPNPQGTAVGKLTKVNIDGTIFSIDEAGSVVIPNKQGTPLFNLDTVEIDGKLYSVNGIGTPVVANPVESASTDLTKIRIDGTPYNIPVNPTEIIANPSGTPSTELEKISINGSLYSIPTTADVEANPSGSATTALNSIGINNTNYYVPVGSMVEANPSTGTTVASLQRITIDGSIYSIDSGGGGSEVIANPSDPATVVLRKLGVDGTVYSIDSGSGTDVEGNPSGTATDTLNKIRISNTIYDVDNGTTVVANPVGTATDDLDSIQIGNIIYDVGSGGGGSSTFAGLSDVSFSNLQDGQIPQYNANSGKWVNSTNTPSSSITKTVTGNPMQFNDGAEAPLVKCVATVQGSQDLHGQTHPWVGGSGKNKWPFGDITGSRTNLPYTFPAGTYTFSCERSNPGTTSVSIRFMWTSGGEQMMYFSTDQTITLTDSTRAISIYVNNGTATNVQLELGSTKTDFEPYENICPITAYTSNTITEKNEVGTVIDTHTAQFATAIYSGSVDCLGGTAECEWAYIASYAGETLPGEWISDRDVYVEGTTPTRGAEVAYALATPTTESISYTNMPIESSYGYNRLENSTGNLEITYITEGLQPIVDLIAASRCVYSSNEQIVGTWIDGSTVYEKTISFTAPSNSYDYFDIATGVDSIIDYTGIVDNGNGSYQNIFYCRADSMNSTYYVMIVENNGIKQVFFRSYTAITATVYITVRYTKTS